jgi:hypothetical protein
MAKAKKTPAYVKKAIEWLEKNAPDGEQIAFINDQEAAHLKSMGGSGKEAVDGVRSYAKGEGPEFGSADIDAIGWGNDPAAGQGVSMDIGQSLGDMPGFSSAESRGPDFPGGVAGDWGGPDIAGMQRSQEQQNLFTLEDVEEAIRQSIAEGSFFPQREFAPRTGGAAAIREAEQTTPPELQAPILPTAPTVSIPGFAATSDQLISDQGLSVAASPTVDPVEQVSTAPDITQPTPTRTPAATMQADTRAGQVGQATAAQLAAPTRTVGDIQGAVPTEELAQAATADLDPRATLKFQLGEITSSIQDGQPLPLWAAPAARNADALMLQRGLGASSMAASARTQSLLEAGLPIASADAQAYGRIQLQNLTNKQAAALQNANTLAAMRTQNLNNRMTAAVNNAQNFLAIDTANLTNKQASNTLSFEAFTQQLFRDQAAENASRQFNATSENQVEQFFSTLENSVAEANANRLTAIRQFNAGEANSFSQFLANQELSREQFNSNQLASIRAANSNWFRSIATINNGNQMAANSFAAQSTLALREREYNQLWQQRRDDANFIFQSVENQLDRDAATAALAQQAAIARSNQSSSRSSSLIGAIGSVVGGLFSSDIRLKTNIEKIGELNPAINLYRWEWNEVAEKMGIDNQPSVGVLAQELIEYRPDLVMMYEDGYFRVNYSGLLS